MRDHRRQPAKMRKIDKRFFRGLIFGRARSDSAKRARRRYWLVSTLLVLVTMAFFLVPSMSLFILMLSPLYDIVLLLPINLMGKVLMFVNFSGGIVGILLGLGVGLAGHFLFQQRVMAEMFVANGYCGSCFYPIDEIAPEPDGCTVCPECGSAWRCRDETRSAA